MSTTAPPRTTNVAARLALVAADRPHEPAVLMPGRRDRAGRRRYVSMTFAELDRDSDVIAAGLNALGVERGTRLALLVRPSIDFVSLVFALFKSGAVSILIDPGMGRQHVLDCLEAARPEGFVALSIVQAVRLVNRRRFAAARYNVTVGRRWFWGGPTLASLRGRPWQGSVLAPTTADDEAAIIFTTGSTGPPKGVLYRHGIFDRQVEEIRDFYDIRPGEIDLACFPLFGLFNSAMGVTTVIPDMDASRPAQADPALLVEAIHDRGVTQSFGSPAVWRRVADYCHQRNVTLPSLRRVMSAGAPVPPDVLERVRAVMHPQGEVHTPYGATEALPVASISASEVLAETRARWRLGGGTCVGRRFAGIEWRVIRASDGPLGTIADVEELPTNEIGELIVRGPVVTDRYVTRTEWNERSKIADGRSFWHRMGDVGYLDEQDRFWFCGRATHRVRTSKGPMYTIPCEAIFNQHPRIYRSALVGIGEPGTQTPVMICQPMAGRVPTDEDDRRTLLAELRGLGAQHEHTRSIARFLLHPDFPVDIRHNAKIFREKLAVWAAQQPVEVSDR